MMQKRVYFAGGFMLVAIVFLMYHPGLRMGFYLDDYNYLERAGRTDWSNAVVQIFDPRLQTMWYRPLQAIQFFLEFQVFGANANAYHLVNMAFHAINVLLLYALVWRISRRWRLGFFSALFFATFPVYASGVNWIGIVDPLTTIFYLLGVWFWWTYLEKQDRLHYSLALGAFVLALLSKQVSITLPLVLFLIDVWIKEERFSVLRTVRRYAPFAVAALVFALVQYGAQSTHTFAGVFGWQLGTTMAFILAQYLVLFFFPWGVFPSLDLNLVEVGNLFSYAWAALGALVLGYMAWKKRSRVLLFLAAFALLNLLPVLPFPFIEHRYLYLPILSAAVILAIILDLPRSRAHSRNWLPTASSAGLALLALGSGLAVNASAIDAAEWARQLRVPFRDIERTHATLPADTLLYFIDPITPTTGGLSGMFFLRYGRGVTVKNWTEPVDLRGHNASFVYYFDDTRRPHEVLVEKNVALAGPSLPVGFEAPLRLDGFELAQANVQRGTALLLLLQWQSVAPIEQDYTVFVHLLNARGEVVAGHDSPPRKGEYQTSQWEPNLLVADAVVMPLGADLPVGGDYRVEIGLYEPRTQQRLRVLDTHGTPAGDAITFGPVSITQ